MDDAFKSYYSVKRQAKNALVQKVVKWLGTSLMLFTINFMVSPHFMWAVFPFLGMGVGVIKKLMEYTMITYDDFDHEMSTLKRQNERSNSRRIIIEDDSHQEKESKLELKDLPKQKQKETLWNDREFV
ncbi:MAG: hypothetical protein KBA06_06480 [Saprospiraceae bacterium]|nr:hypothetical protein [Saprospiraceae bacterium]